MFNENIDGNDDVDDDMMNSLQSNCKQNNEIRLQKNSIIISARCVRYLEAYEYNWNALPVTLTFSTVVEIRFWFSPFSMYRYVIQLYRSIEATHTASGKASRSVVACTPESFTMLRVIVYTFWLELSINTRESRKVFSNFPISFVSLV